jgi:hypothetical protein
LLCFFNIKEKLTPIESDISREMARVKGLSPPEKKGQMRFICP